MNNIKVANQELLTATKNGDLETIKQFIHNDSIVSGDINSISYYDLVLSAFINGQLEVIKYLFDIPEVRDTISKQVYSRDLVITASRKGYRDIVQYLFNNPQLLYDNDNDLVFMAARFSASKGHTEIVKDLIEKFPNDSELKIALKEGKLFNIACENDQLDTVKYFIDNKMINELNDLHFDNDKAFKLTSKNPTLKVMQYFIFDLSLQQTQAIKNYLSAPTDANKELIKGWFRVRDLQNSLDNKLNDSNIANSKKVKI